LRRLPRHRRCRRKCSEEQQCREAAPGGEPRTRPGETATLLGSTLMVVRRGSAIEALHERSAP
jgi:hypothetical protein